MTDQLPVYLVHWNAPDWLRASVGTILLSDRAVTITIVNNGPAEASAALALPAEVRIIPTGANLGYTGGANAALRDWLAGDDPYCIVGAHDLTVERSDLRLLVEAAEAAPSFGILGPGTDGGYDAGELLGISEGLEERSTMSGTCLLLRRDCILDIGLFDEQFGSYGEDNELCWRARQRGWKVGRVPGTFAHGLGSSAPNNLTLRGRAIILLKIKTAGRVAALRRIGRFVLSLGLSLTLMWLPNEVGRRRSLTAKRAWGAIRHGTPLLFARMQDPPIA